MLGRYYCTIRPTLFGAALHQPHSTNYAIICILQVRLQCSHPGQYYQGSYDRFALISGPALANVVGAITHILQLLHGDQLQPATLRLVLPIAAAGAVIGVGGQVQRELMQLSQASIQFAPTAGLIAERVVSISGSCSQVLRATEAVLSKVWRGWDTGYCNGSTCSRLHPPCLMCL